MSPIDSISPTASSGSLGSVAAANGVDKDKFLALLVSQIRNQNPLEPVSNDQFLSQLTQFSSLEAAQNTNASLQTLIQLQSLTAGISQLSEATAFLGKNLTYIDPITGANASGVAQSVSVVDGAVVVNVGGTAVPLLLITGVQPAGSTPASAPPPASGSNGSSSSSSGAAGSNADVTLPPSGIASASA